MGEHVFHRSTGIIDSHGLKGIAGFIALLPLYFADIFRELFSMVHARADHFAPLVAGT